VPRCFIINTKWLTFEIIEILKQMFATFSLQLELLDLDHEGLIGLDLDSKDLVFVLIDPMLDRNEQACQAINQAASKGVRVVGIWPLAQPDMRVPAILDKKGSGAVTCDRSGFESLLGSSATGVWLEPGGNVRPEQQLKRGGC
jgi:hypothetical protein